MAWVTAENRETWHTMIAVGLFVVGSFSALWAMIAIEPLGEIPGSVLGFVGETFTPAGGLLGVVTYTQNRLKQQNKRLERMEKAMNIKDKSEDESFDN